MATTYVKVTTRDGEVTIAEFEKLKGIRRLAADVMGGRKAMPVWTPVADRHPHSGEPTLVRRRRFINGDLVAEMEIVEPADGMEETHGLDPANFEPAPLVKSGPAGTWTAPLGEAEGDVAEVEGAVPGAQYPIHRDPADQRRFVILSYVEDEGEQVRHYLDPEVSGARTSYSYEDDDAEWDEDYDEDDYV